MTDEQSAQIEDLLQVWYEYEHKYFPALGAPKVSVSCRDHQPETGDVHTTSSDRDEILDKLKAELVGSCIDELHYLERAAINVHCRNKAAGADVHRNPRIDDHHRAYQDAKLVLFPKLKRKGLLG